MQQLATVLAALLLLSSTAYGQDRYYYSDERKIPIEKSGSWKVEGWVSPCYTWPEWTERPKRC